MLPREIENLILDYAAQMLHAELLDRVHCELFCKSYILWKPPRLLSVSYFFSLSDTDD